MPFNTSGMYSWHDRRFGPELTSPFTGDRDSYASGCFGCHSLVSMRPNASEKVCASHSIISGSPRREANSSSSTTDRRTRPVREFAKFLPSRRIPKNICSKIFRIAARARLCAPACFRRRARSACLPTPIYRRRSTECRSSSNRSRRMKSISLSDRARCAGYRSDITSRGPANRPAACLI